MTFWDPIRFLNKSLRRGQEEKPRRRHRTASPEGRGWRTWIWPVGGMVLLTVLHFLLLPIAPRLVSDFPRLGEISEAEIRAPFTFTAPLPEQDIEMAQYQRALREPPVFERLPGQETLTNDRLTVLSEMVRGMEQLPRQDRRERLDYLALHATEWETRDLARLEAMDDPELFVEASVSSITTLLASGIVDDLPTGDFQKIRVLSGNSEPRRPRGHRPAGPGPLEALRPAGALRIRRIDRQLGCASVAAVGGAQSDLQDRSDPGTASGRPSIDAHGTGVLAGSGSSIAANASPPRTS